MTEPAPDKITPMLRQYLDIKAQHPDGLLLFQMGDFYEFFFQNAHRAALLIAPAVGPGPPSAHGHRLDGLGDNLEVSVE